MRGKPHILLALLAVVASTEGVLVPHKPQQNTGATTATANRKPPQPPGHSSWGAEVTPLTSTSESTTTATVTNRRQPKTTEHSAGDGEATPTLESTTSTSQDATGGNAGEQEPPLHNEVFITDAATSPHHITLPENESASSLYFWSPVNGTSSIITFISLTRNFTLNVTTIMPRHWHSIDVYQPTEGPTSTVQLFFRTESRYINMEYSRVSLIQAGSNDLIHWCFCPNAHLCALPAAEEPVEGKTYSSEERVGLVAALVVVVVLLVISLVALAAVTFYRKAELFHIYAKPIDCLPNGPPPLPRPNTEPTRRHKDTKLAEAQNGDTVTDQPDDTRYSREVVKSSAVQSRPSSLAYPPVSYEPHKIEDETINSLYGLI